MKLKQTYILIFLSLLGLLAVAPVSCPADTVEKTIEIYVSAEADDATEEADWRNSTLYLYRDYLELGRDRYTGIRFQGVSIPEGAVIDSAYLVFTAYENANGNTNLTIWGENTGSADAFSDSNTVTALIQSKATTNFTKWTNMGNWQAGTTYNSADIKAIVQEITAVDDWDSDSANDIAFLISGEGKERKVYSYDYADANDVYYMPMLYIKYTIEEDDDDDDSPSVIDTGGVTTLGETCYEGNDADSSTFTLTNSGAGTMDYTISDDADWITLSTTSGTLSTDESVTVTVTYDTDEKDVGTYEATITISDSGASNTPQQIAVSVTIMEENTAVAQLPLYAEDIVSPSILLLLDVSSSMTTNYMDVYSEEAPTTPDLSDIIEEIVARDGWSSGNNMAFIITGSGNRRAVSYDGASDDAPILHVEFTDGSEDLDIPVNLASDDAIEDGDGHMSLNDTILSMVDDDTSQKVGLRFQDVAIPNGASIDTAYIQFTISQTDDSTTTLVIKGEDVDSASTFEGGWNGDGMYGSYTDDDNISDRETTSASVSWSITEEWTGATQKTRMEIGRSVISNLVTDRDVYWGYGTWAGEGSTDARTDSAGTSISGKSYASQTSGSVTDYTIIHVGCSENDDAHLLALQDAIDATDGQMRTPFEPSLVAGNAYFTGGKTDDYGDTYSANDCQSLILIDITDGLGNKWTSSGDETTLIKTAVATLAGNEISTVVVGFGIDDATQINVAADLANDLGDANPDDKLYALHEEDTDGTGIPFIANNESELATALADITDAVKDALFHGSAPAASTTTDLGNILLVASFDAGEWSGDLEAYEKDSDDNWTVVKWTASDKMPDSDDRSFYTVDSSSGSDVVSKYTATTTDNYPLTYHSCKVLGDIINSTPIVINDPSYYYKFDDYSTFAALERDSMIYVGANDGALHAIKLEDGIEQWAFVPESLQTKLALGLVDTEYDMCSDDYLHQYYVDGSPQAADVYIQLGTETSPSWKTILVTGLGGGGEAYFALDVTYGKAFDASEKASAYMWEFTDDDLGMALSEPSIERVNASSDTTWAVFLGSGYASTDTAQLSKEAYLFGIMAEDAGPLWSYTDSDGNTSDINKIQINSGRTDNALASPLVAEIDDDYIADCIYVGDLYGTMYKVKDIDFGETPTVSTLLDMGLSDNSTSPIRAQATYAYSDTAGEIWVYWGTGIYENQTDKASTSQQYFFGVKDTLDSIAETETDTLVSLSTKTIEYSYTDDNGDTQYEDLRYIDGDNEACDPWRILLETGGSGSERVLKSAYVTGGVVFFTTFIPADDLCSGTGTSWLFAVDYETGGEPDEPVFDINGDGVIDDGDIVTDADGNKIIISGIQLGEEGSGIASDVVLNGDSELLVNTTSDGTKSILVNLQGLNITLESWRHLF